MTQLLNSFRRREGFLKSQSLSPSYGTATHATRRTTNVDCKHYSESLNFLPTYLHRYLYQSIDSNPSVWVDPLRNHRRRRRRRRRRCRFRLSVKPLSTVKNHRRQIRRRQSNDYNNNNKIINKKKKKINCETDRVTSLLHYCNSVNDKNASCGMIVL